MDNLSNKISSIVNNTLKPEVKPVGNIVLCYGHFNVIHPGHMRYLKYAKSLGDTLVVALQDDSMLQKKKSKNYFSQNERAEGLSSLSLIDHVFILENGNLQALLKLITPKIMVLGSEHEIEHNEKIDQAIFELEKNNGEVIFHSGDAHYANTELLHSNIDQLEKEKINYFNVASKKQGLNADNLKSVLEQIQNTEMLVIGDTIIDQYVGCDALGMSSEAPVLVVRELESKEYLGGAAIVASHVRELGATCHFLSVIGDDIHTDYVIDKLKERDVDSHLIKDNSRPTTYKIRYMVESQKLFRVSRLKEHKISHHIEEKIITKVEQLASTVDGIIISDFVYGVITEKVIQEIKRIAKENNIKLFADVQCSSQIGSVLKFKGFDLVFPTEREARIALNNNVEGVEWIANKLMEELYTNTVLVKLGSEGFITYSKESEDFILRQHFPALTVNPVDVTGAGDSMMAAMASCISSGSNLMEASAIGACMAALAVKEIGNTPISNKQVLEYITYIYSK